MKLQALLEGFSEIAKSKLIFPDGTLIIRAASTSDRGPFQHQNLKIASWKLDMWQEHPSEVSPDVTRTAKFKELQIDNLLSSGNLTKTEMQKFVREFSGKLKSLGTASKAKDTFSELVRIADEENMDEIMSFIKKFIRKP